MKTGYIKLVRVIFSHKLNSDIEIDHVVTGEVMTLIDNQIVNLDFDVRAATILIGYYSLDDDRGKETLKKLGAMCGVSSERIRQIREGAIRRLKHPTRSQFLYDAFKMKAVIGFT
jgi:DNA-directed RNA polymerase sigma subunit (sigma70/sigma32)